MTDNTEHSEHFVFGLLTTVNTYGSVLDQSAIELVCLMINQANSLTIVNIALITVNERAFLTRIRVTDYSEHHKQAGITSAILGRTFVSV